MTNLKSKDMTFQQFEQLKTEAQELQSRTVAFRRAIHASPELSFAEHSTARYITQQLATEGILCRPIAGTGVLAQIEGNGDLSRCVVLRADMDALPVQEQTGLPFASHNEGVMHACGHDMHVAALLGALILLNRRRSEIEGTVFGLFQPGEEVDPGGATLVLAEDPFKEYQVQAVVGEHVDAEIPVGQLGFRPGRYMASGDEVHITVHGQGGHGALPHNLKDPVVATAALITALQQVVSRNLDSRIPSVLSFGRVMADGATNVIPSEVLLEGTFRTMDEEWRMVGKQRIREIAVGIATAHGVEVDVEIVDGYPCVVNDPELTVRARQIAAGMWGDEQIIKLDLRMTAEDFGYYAERYPSLLFRLGTADPDGTSGGGLHTGTFNPKEEALEQGVATMAALGIALLERETQE